jgi:serine/threonine protein kinase
MAPELLNPSQFDLANSIPTKESDIYSLAVTAYEVCLSLTPCVIIVDIALLR